MDSTQQGWLSRILHAIENFFTGAQDEIHKIATEASTITNNIKAWASSPAGITIENIVADLVPPELTLAFKDWLPTLFKDLNFATNAADYLTDDHIIQQAGYSQKAEYPYILRPISALGSRPRCHSMFTPVRA